MTLNNDIGLAIRATSASRSTAREGASGGMAPKAARMTFTTVSYHLVTVLEPSLTEETAEAIMTGAERLMERGRQEGLATGQAKGELQGRIKALKAQIELSFGSPSAETTARLENASVDELDRWNRRMLSVDSLERLFAE